MSHAGIVGEPRLGEHLGHYLLLQKLGAGGMGEVYLARDEHLDREVAVKLLPPGVFDSQTRLHFRQEALTLSRLSHPNVAVVHDFDTHQETDFLVTEYIPGKGLDEKLEEGPLPESEILQLGVQLAEGLSAAHDQGVVHRDLKPSNLRITPDGRLKILDFGLAHGLNLIGESAPTQTEVGTELVSGTLLYMAPEQLLGQVTDQRSDLYSVGTVLYEMATGRTPFTAKIATVLVDAILHKPPLPPARLRPEISSAVEQILLKCLEKEPAHRYQSALELAVDLRRAMQDRHTEKSVAVLYFENLSGQREDEYFRDGITEDIITELSRIKQLRLFSRSSVLAYRDKPVTPALISEQLNARYVLEGSVRREAKRLRISAKLVETHTGHCVWAERYDRQMEDVFAIQDEIATSIAKTLEVVLTETEKLAIQKPPTTQVEAYDFYLRGREFFHQFRRKGYDFARQMFARAIELDPAYARAYAGIADCCSFLYLYWESTEQHLEEADIASRKALELDPDLAEAHASRGFAASLKKLYAEAEREFRTAMRLAPGLFEPYYFYARNCYAQGKLEEAVQWFAQAAQVNPEDYQSPMLMASALHGLGRKEEATGAYRRGLNAAQNHLLFHPGDARALYFGANALSQLNEKERSIEWAERALALEPEEPQVLYNVACVYALLGEPERAIDCLEKSMTKGWGQKEWMEHDPDLASLRENPRFRKLIEKP